MDSSQNLFDNIGAICRTRSNRQVFVSFQTSDTGFLTGVSYAQFTHPFHASGEPQAFFWAVETAGEEDPSAIFYSLGTPDMDVVKIVTLISLENTWITQY